MRITVFTIGLALLLGVVPQTTARAGFLSSTQINPYQYTLCPNPIGTISEGKMPSAIYHTEVIYSLYLPPCIENNPQTRFPVVYLLNGQTFTHDQWVRLGIASLADEMISARTIPPVIIVMPNDQDWRQPSESPFGSMLIKEMVPYIDSSYPTIGDRESRAIGGLSRGASWALRLGLTDWALFSRIGAHSLPVFAADEDTIPRWLGSIPDGMVPAIYIDTGNQDPEINHARSVEAILSARHLPHEWHLFVGDHDETYWHNHLEKYLCWYACEWAVLYYN